MRTFMSASVYFDSAEGVDSATRISVSIAVAFIARALGTIPGDLFCYSAISSAGVAVILPGFTVCESTSD